MPCPVCLDRGGSRHGGRWIRCPRCKPPMTPAVRKAQATFNETGAGPRRRLDLEPEPEPIPGQLALPFFGRGPDEPFPCFSCQLEGACHGHTRGCPNFVDDWPAA